MFSRPSLFLLCFFAATELRCQDNPQPSLPKLRQPVRIDAGGKPIDTESGHSAPLFYDWNRDGKKDLLVGEYGPDDVGGRLRIYLNVGTATEPRFDTFSHFEAGGKTATVPSR